MAATTRLPATPAALAVDGAAAALGDEGRLRLGKLRGGRRPAVAPCRLRQCWRRAAAGATAGRPAPPFAGIFAIAGVAADPADIDSQRIGEAGQRGRLLLGRAHEHIIEPLQPLGDAVPRFADHHRQDALALQLGMIDFPVADRRGDRIRADEEDHGVGGVDQPAQPRLPVLAGGDVVLVEIGVEPLRTECGVQPVGGCRVAARIGNEHIGLARGRAAFGLARRRAGLLRHLAPNSSAHCSTAAAVVNTLASICDRLCFCGKG